MNKGGILNGEEALEAGISIAKKAGKTVAGAASDTAKAATSQVTGSQNKDTQDVVNHLYGRSEEKSKRVKELESQSSDNQPENTPEAIEKKKKIEELRQQLHREVYYDPLVNPKKTQEEERPAEKVEKEKQEEMIDLQKKEEKKPPPLVQRTRERVEKYPGASG